MCVFTVLVEMNSSCWMRASVRRDAGQYLRLARRQPEFSAYLVAQFFKRDFRTRRLIAYRKSSDIVGRAYRLRLLRYQEKMTRNAP